MTSGRIVAPGPLPNEPPRRLLAPGLVELPRCERRTIVAATTTYASETSQEGGAVERLAAQETALQPSGLGGQVAPAPDVSDLHHHQAGVGCLHLVHPYQEL